jgi:hypothetical protein
MADGSAPAGLTDAALRRLALDLAPLGDLDGIGGLVARYRDPRERGGTGGEQRDAAAALDAASDAGRLTAARVAWAPYTRLDADLRRTAWWIAQRGRAVRDGAIVGVSAWALTYGTLEGPGADRERLDRLTVAAEGARLRMESLKRSTRGGCSPELAREISDARALHTQASGALTDVTDRLRAWGLARFEALAVAWEAEKERSEAA